MRTLAEILIVLFIAGLIGQAVAFPWWYPAYLRWSILRRVTKGLTETALRQQVYGVGHRYAHCQIQESYDTGWRVSVDTSYGHVRDLPPFMMRLHDMVGEVVPTVGTSTDELHMWNAQVDALTARLAATILNRLLPTETTIGQFPADKA